MRRAYAVQYRDFAIRPAQSRRDAKRDRDAYGGLLVSRRGTGAWKPYRRGIFRVAAYVHLDGRDCHALAGEPR